MCGRAGREERARNNKRAGEQGLEESERDREATYTHLVVVACFALLACFDSVHFGGVFRFRNVCTRESGADTRSASVKRGRADSPVLYSPLAACLSFSLWNHVLAGRE